MAISLHRRTALLAGIAAIVSAGIATFVVDLPSQAQQAPQLPAVQVQAAASRLVHDWEIYSGRLEAIEQVQIRPRVEGTLLAVHFRDGQLVRQGDLLFTIDPA